MTPTRQATRSRPAYFRGQLLDEDDFRAEQDYHRNAALAHNTRFHSWGVVDGLTVSFQGSKKIAVAPGCALDSSGREIHVKEEAILDVSSFESDEPIYVVLSYDEGPGEQKQSEHGEGASRTLEYSVLSAAASEGAGVTLASVRLESGKRGKGSVSYDRTKYASSVLAPGQVGYRELSTAMRSGWVRLPFKPIPVDEVDQEGKPVTRRRFYMGPTEAKSDEQGATGSMAIPVPPGATRLRRFRIAGEKNEGTIKVEFWRCGWDAEQDDHEKTSMLTVDFDSTSPRAAPPGRPAKKATTSFEYTKSLHGDLDSEYHALAVVVTATRKASISLIAVEFGYPGDTAAE